MTAYTIDQYAITATLPSGGITKFGLKAGSTEAALAAARQRLPSAARRGAEFTAEPLAPPLARQQPETGTGRFGIRLSYYPGTTYQERFYLTPRAQRDAAITYLLRGYEVKLLKRADGERPGEDDYDRPHPLATDLCREFGHDWIADWDQEAGTEIECPACGTLRAIGPAPQRAIRYSYPPLSEEEAA